MRADKVHAEYLAKARALDWKWCGAAARRSGRGAGQGVVGPVERRLVSFGRVPGIVFGYYGEMSKDASELLAFAAGEIAARTWEMESAGASLDAASALMTRRLYQNWGVTSAREVTNGRPHQARGPPLDHRRGKQPLRRRLRPCGRGPLRPRPQPRLRQQRARARGLGAHLSCL